MRLSPLNFRGLLHTMNIVGEPGPPENPARSTLKRQAIACWRCAECDDIHDWESDAEECCAAEDAKEAPSAPACPVCAEKYDTHRGATDCCLWKDIPAQRRWQMADAVEAGSTWADQLLLPHARDVPASMAVR